MRIDHVSQAMKIGSEALSKGAEIVDKVSSLLKDVEDQGQDPCLTQTNKKEKEEGLKK